MNNIVELKGKFNQAPSLGKPGLSGLPKGGMVTVEHINKLKKDLMMLKEFWLNEEYVEGALISVHYTCIVAKSRRIKSLLSYRNSKPNSTIVGAKFTQEPQKHIITHYIPIDTITESIDRLDITIEVINTLYGDVVNYEDINDLVNNKKSIKTGKISKSAFVQTVVDCYYVEKFDIPENHDEIGDKVIVNLYKSTEDTKEILRKIGIDILSDRIIDGNVLLYKDQIELLKNKAPYLISMITSDISKIAPIDKSNISDYGMKTIPDPTNEPTIGVIDTLFDERVYFSKWVENHKMIPDDIINFEDYEHGTMVDSVIADGPSLNPDLDDGCGRFKVRHFGVASSKTASSFTILKKIKEIILQNKDIKVWNLSLGSTLQVDINSISPEASILDKIQYENDVIFVVSGTNIPHSWKGGDMRIGAPADSINSLVVNSVDEFNNSASYSRMGPVLSFFNKPDISCFGGDKSKKITVCGSTSSYEVVGTSFSAPWISRKLCYLIDILGLSRECAKALLIDSAIGWKELNRNEMKSMGYGVVPQDIKDIIHSKDNEIKFIINGISEKYDTYVSNIAVPMVNDKYPFVAKAVLCYFPNCSRSQGVDYTNTEMDISFGRIGDDGKIKTINDNYQTTDEQYTYEKTARSNFRKWDNVKYVMEIPKTSKKDKKSYKNNKSWGISIKTKERLDNFDGNGLKFGVVVTLKEIHNVNRIESFIKNSRLNGWIVNPIIVEERLDIYESAEEEITLE